MDSERKNLESSHNEDYFFEYRFPYPLADLYRRYRVARTPVDRLGYLLAAGEASLKFLTAFAFARSIQTPELTESLAGLQQQSESPSFGTWRQLLEAARPIVADQGTPQLELELARCIRDSHGNAARYLNAIQVIVEQRNLYVHGGTITNDAAEMTLAEVLPSFRTAFRELAFLGQAQLILCEEVRWNARPPCFEAIVRMCSGCNPVFSYEIWRLETPLSPQTPYLVSPDFRTAFALRPFVLIVTDERLRLPHSYFYFRTRKTPIWHTYEMARDNEYVGTSSIQEDLKLALSGNLSSSSVELKFIQGARPVWATGLAGEQTPELPSGYKMLGQIGEGRYAVVYRVLHTGMRETRAYKILRPSVAQDPRMRKRVEIEAQSLSRLRGTGAAIELYEHGETPNGLPYLTLQLADEGSLEEAMRRWGPKSWQEVLQLGVECFRALDTLHEHGIFHRDIKLSNILLLGGKPKFCDFGVSRLIETEDHLTIEGDAIGTIAYMAPEVRKGAFDARSDIFSMGISLVFLLAGKADANPRGFLYRDYQGDDEFRKAMLNFIEPVAANRPPSAGAAAARLEGIIERLNRARQALETASDKPNTAITSESELPELRHSKEPSRIWSSRDGTAFRFIMPGEFLMGGTKYPDERPVHEVTIKEPFFLATTLVTNAQYRAFVSATRYRGSHRNFLHHFNSDSIGPEWRRPRCPVVFVSWRDAREYVLWCCERDDIDYRLPTEAQWEYACRAGTRTVYSWGNEYDPAQLNADNIHGCPTPVGSYPPNPLGIFDMLGNVWEWCEDMKDVLPKEESLFYRQCAEMEAGQCVDPINSGSSPVLSRRVEDSLRVVRGGSFHSAGRNFRPANRRGQYWKDCVRSIGFRLVAYNPPSEEVRVVT